jgi:NTP pyrophosphatase (non-canonical NTP hydrolase)
MTREEILQAAVDTYGVKAQEDVCIEEMSELTKAIIKNRRSDGAATANIIEEIADVQIMLDEMRLIYGSTEEQDAFKINRLQKRIAKEKEKRKINYAKIAEYLRK